MADLKTNLLGFVMNSPVIGASGTVGYGVEIRRTGRFSKIGGISGKGLTLHGQYGNKGERLWETPSGLINSIGLQNPGVQHFIDVELGEMLELKQKYGTVAIANLGGHSEEEYVEGAALLSESAVDIVELNISCPNVKVGGMAYGVKAEAAGEVVRMVPRSLQKAPDGQAEPPGREHPRDVQGCGGRRCGRHRPDQHLPGLRHRSGKAPPGVQQHLCRSVRPGGAAHRPAHGLAGCRCREHPGGGSGRHCHRP